MTRKAKNPVPGSSVTNQSLRSDAAIGDEPIAIVGAGCVFPGAQTLAEFWHILEQGIDLSRPAPAGRWVLESRASSNQGLPMTDAVYTDRGYFVEGFRLEPQGLNISRELLQEIDLSVHFLLHAGKAAFKSARMDSVDRTRVGVVVGNIALPTEGASKLAEALLSPLFGANAATPELLATPSRGLAALNRYVSGLPAGLLAQALGLGGGTSTVDAACASSLYALKLACDELRAGRADAMLSGGMSRPDSLYTQMGFCQLQALSRTGRCSPFDKAGNGLLVGEGAGVIILKRLSDALRDGDKIMALVRGIGLSTDLEGNLLQPNSDGQIRALRQAYEKAGWSPAEVDFIECHATGTPVGDSVEFASLMKLWAEVSWRPGQCTLGAVKANIGHLLTAAGSASLIKTLLSFQNRTLPPMANFEEPASGIALTHSPFRLLVEPEPWEARGDAAPRRAGINGFGFGGINAHVLLEEWLGPKKKGPRSTAKTSQNQSQIWESGKANAGTNETEIAIVGLAATIGPWRNLKDFRERVLNGLPAQPRSRPHWRGVMVSSDGLSETKPWEPLGFYLNDLSIPVNRYRIPPKELGEILPQEILMLEVARAALEDTKSAETDSTRCGVFVGLGLDLRTTDFHLRWAELARRKRGDDDPGVAGGGVAGRIPPVLTADRTLGALAGINASRIAKEFHFGGASYTVCSEDCSGTRALEIGVRSLDQGELDQVVVGGVDIAGDLRSLWSTDSLRPYSRRGTSCPFDQHSDGAIPGEGAVALVLKRLADARRDGDRVYAVIRGIGSASSTQPQPWGKSKSKQPTGPEAPGMSAYRLALQRAYGESRIEPCSVGYVETDSSGWKHEDQAEAREIAAYFGSEHRKTVCHLGNVKGAVGHTGAVSGLVSVLRATLALHHEIIPGFENLRQPIAELSLNAASQLDGLDGVQPALNIPRASQYWVRNREEGPRRAGVSCSSIDGNVMHVVLEEAGNAEEEVSPNSGPEPVQRSSESLFVIPADERGQLPSSCGALRELANKTPDQAFGQLSREWWRRVADSRNRTWMSIIAQDKAQLVRLLDQAQKMGQTEDPAQSFPFATEDRDRVWLPRAKPLEGRMAFVFPGAGSYFPDMGRELWLRWPEIPRKQDQQNARLADQVRADHFWNASKIYSPGADQRAAICGQVALGTMVSDLAVNLGLKPEAALGYSLGESTALFALGAWRARDEMLRRVMESSLFRCDLTGTPEQLRKFWRSAGSEVVEWKAGVVNRPAVAVRAAIREHKRIYLLIINSPTECVIGGNAPDVDEVINELACTWVPLQGVSTVHCELLLPFEKPYRELHQFETNPPAGIQFFSGGFGRAFQPNKDTAAEAIVAQARDTVDFPKLVERAYDEGIRYFIEMGPGSSCSRMISNILGNKPHLARSLCASAQEPVLGILRVIGQLAAEGAGLDLDKFYSFHARAEVDSGSNEDFKTPCVRIAITGDPLLTPVADTHSSPATAPPGTTRKVDVTIPMPEDAFELECARAMQRVQTATLEAHEAFLKFSQGSFEAISALVQAELSPTTAGRMEMVRPKLESDTRTLETGSVEFDRAACLEFARGSVAKVLGEAFELVDSFPTRVRLPDEPLMLVDRILEVRGQTRSMTSGMVVTEHDILPGAWYLDGGCIPTCLAVEAGQADLFLSGYLGIDFQTRGKAVYRLLDAKVKFHSELPGAGETIHYEIAIDRFFQQSGTWLFNFHFEATVGGRPLLTMTDGCAGFFTAEQLANGQGIVRTALELKKVPGTRAADWREWVPMAVESYSESQLDSLRAGELSRCFGPAFARLPIQRPLTLPDGRMRLVHRVSHLEPQGGRFGLGLIRGEADIHSDDWFLTCHFVDDRVMPGTLMFECCLHTLRIYLLRLGWIFEEEETLLEPLPGVVSQLKCRGQVLENTKQVTYEVSIKEIGYRPEPYAIADALMFADGAPIVAMSNMSLRYRGVTRQRLEEIWQAPRTRQILYDTKQILAFAIGKPSEAFGAAYEPFDNKRQIARLPGPPYQFLDRITEVQGKAFQMAAGAVAEGEYDVPTDAWYFAENREQTMPFAVLLEVALQPCGWLAAYLGSALTSAEDLAFRNLGGKACQFASVTPKSGTLVTRVKLTRVSSSAGMILQWFDFEVRTEKELVYRGDTYFGFFPKEALARQEGIQNAKLQAIPPEDLALAKALNYPTTAPFPGTQMRMLDQVDLFLPKGGPHGLGLIRGSKRVEPDAWFFKAHFYQDPVVPGSLGLESMLQLMKFVALERWGYEAGCSYESVVLNETHEWIYRGQVIPTNGLVEIEAVITESDDAERMLKADGLLVVDGRVIYAMKNFTLRCHSSGTSALNGSSNGHSPVTV